LSSAHPRIPSADGWLSFAGGRSSCKRRQRFRARKAEQRKAIVKMLLST
jgi:hypothetical protein